jgi:hypothetical protein
MVGLLKDTQKLCVVQAYATYKAANQNSLIHSWLGLETPQNKLDLKSEVK